MNRRTLIVLAVVAGLSIVFAAIAVWRISQDYSTPQGGQLLFPDLGGRVQDVSRIEVTTDSGTTLLDRRDTVWVLPGKNDYPADPARVVTLESTLAAMTLLEAKTANPSRYAALGLEDAKKDSGTSRLVRLLDKDGQPLAAAMFGHAAVSMGRLGGGVYVRRMGEAQTWLAEGAFNVPVDAPGWMDRTLFAITSPAEIKSVILSDGKPVLKIARVKADDQSFTFDPKPAGKPDQGKAMRLAASLVGLDFDDVKPAGAEKPAKARQALFQGFDGTEYRLTLYPTGKDIWVKAEEQGSGTDVAAFNAAHAKWLYKLPDYRAALLTAASNDFTAKAGPVPVASGKNK